MSREMIKDLIEFIPEKDIETVYRLIVKFLPEDEPLPDELEAITAANDSIKKYGTIPHEAINWD